MNMINEQESSRRAKLWEQGYWEIPDGLDTTDFDFTWRPHKYDRPYIHQFGTQWQKTGGPRFVVPDNEGVKYQYHMIAKRLPDPTKFTVLVNDYDVEMDWSWHPDDTEPPFIWTFGNQFRNSYEMPTVEYRVDNATERKHVNSMIAKLKGKAECWRVLIPIEDYGFDFTWCPDLYEPPYIYTWGNQWNDATVEPTIEYIPKSAQEQQYYRPVERKHMTNFTPRVKSSRENWNILIPIDERNFDFSWRPNPLSPPYIYIWGNQWNDSITEPTVEYHVPGATERKYMTDTCAQVLSEQSRWQILNNIDENEFDFSWRPNPYEPPYIYVWGNQWRDATVEPTVEYHVPGATERKYVETGVAQLKTDYESNSENWRILVPVDESDFDFSWRSDDTEPPYIYVWGNQWWDATVEPTVEYHVPGATERKYITDFKFTTLPNTKNWNQLKQIDQTLFDWSWRPNPYEPPYIYVWGNQWHTAAEEPTVEYHVTGATERKYVEDSIARLKTDYESNSENWKILIPVDKVGFDWSWRPEHTDIPYIYVWGNQWWDAMTEPTVEYHVPGATERKYMTDVTVKVLSESDLTSWTIPKNFDRTKFDWSWRPNPKSPPQIYQWENGGPMYTVTGATEIVYMETVEYNDSDNSSVARYYIETTLEDLINQHPDEIFWALNADLKYDDFDFSWKPNSKNFRHVNAFGNKNSKDTGTYYINAPVYLAGYREINYVDEVEVTITTDLDMFYVMCGNQGSEERYESLKLQYPKLQKTRFLNGWVETIARCLRKATTRFVWILSSEHDYQDFKFDYYPSSWVQDKIHVFGNQWTHWGNTYLVNSETFDEDTRYVKIIEHLPNINHVRNRRATKFGGTFDIVYIDHGNNTNSLSTLKNMLPNTEVTVLKYTNSYLNTFKQWIENLPEYTIKDNHPVWICSSLCYYDNFDFSWTSDPFQSEQLHVFASELDKTKQKFGDTFFVNLSVLKQEIKKLVDLEQYGKKVNYVSYLSAKRWEHLVMYHDHDSQVDAVHEFKNNFSGPYIELINDESCPETVKRIVPNVWNLNRSEITIGTTGASQILVPRPAFDKIGQEIYDYPYIDSVSKLEYSKPIDIVFISNGEPSAEENYSRLEQLLTDRKILNRLHRVKNVDGRVASQHAAANTSTTDWYFLVNGKIRINPEFDFSWQPDRLQQAKHYIFTATNPVNGLEYGHQAIVANNRRLTLSTVTRGLDFTMESLHAVVEQNCGIAIYDTDSWTTWRTAFREAIKLRVNQDEVSAGRLKIWCTVGNGNFGDWSIRGALDAVEYYDSVNGELDKLMNSYDWQWLENYYQQRYQN